MADKPNIKFTVRQQANRATGGVVYVPSIIDRDDSLTMEDIILGAIDRGLIVAIKPNAAKAFADAIMQQMFEELKQGNGIKFGDYFYARLYLDGTTDGNGTLTAERNGINVRLYKGDGFKLALSDFEWTNVAAGSIPGLDFLISEADGAERGKLIPDANVQVNGTSLCGDADDSQKVVFTEVVESGTPQVVEVASTDFITKGVNLVTFAYPNTLVGGKTYKVHFERVLGGATYVSGNVAVTVNEAE